MCNITFPAKTTYLGLPSGNSTRKCQLIKDIAAKNIEDEMNYNAIIFDMDGTIISTEHVWSKATSETLMRHGIKKYSANQIKTLNSLSGIGMRQAWELLRKAFQLDDHINILIEETNERARKHFSNGIDFIHGFEEFHKELQSHKINSGIATNADAKSLQHIANSMKFERFFGKDMYCISDVSNKAKPDPALFLHTANKLGAKPHECIIFEDSIYGFQAAEAAGIKCIAIKNEKNEQHRIHAHDEIDDYHQAIEVLRRII